MNLPNPETNALIARMISFDENAVYDGYPTMTCSDEALIEASCIAASDTVDWMRHTCFVASEYAAKPQHVQNCQRFIKAMMETCFACNMIEGSNDSYCDMNDDESDVPLLF